MKNKYIILGTLLVVLASTKANAQQGFGTSNPAPSSVIDAVSATKGVLLPRVTLTGLTDITTIANAANSLTVFNTANAGVVPNDVTPGYYYWSVADTKWVKLLTSFTQDLRLIGTNHITQDAGNGSNGTGVGTGLNNIAMGKDALMSNTTGIQNIAIGVSALKANTTGRGNLVISNSDGTFESSGASNTTGNYNLVLGGDSFTANTSGEYNIAIGGGALYENTIGNYNTAIGGMWTMGQNKTGLMNTAIGTEALTNMTVGVGNTAIGVMSLPNFLGDNNTNSVGNIGLGYNSGNNLKSGKNNILIGLNAEAKVSPTGSNQLNIGNWIFGDTGKIGLGTAIIPTNTLHISGGTVNPVRFEGLKTGLSTDNLVVVDATGNLKTLTPSALTTEPFQIEGTTTKASTNIQNIYQSGNLGLGDFTASFPLTKLDVRGAVRVGTPHADEIAGTSAIGVNSASFGTNNKITGINSGAFGSDNNVFGANSFVYGDNNTARGQRSFVGGSGNQIMDANSQLNVVLGIQNTVTGTSANNFVLGSSNIVTTANTNYGTNDNLVTGSGNTVRGWNNFISGTGNGMDFGVEGSAIFGAKNHIGAAMTGRNLLSGMNNSTLGADYSAALGLGLKSINYAEAVVGSYNQPISGALFTIGNGSGPDNSSLATPVVLSNALVVTRNQTAGATVANGLIIMAAQLPKYTNVTDATNDTSLPSGAFYKVSGVLYQKD